MLAKKLFHFKISINIYFFNISYSPILLFIVLRLNSQEVFLVMYILAAHPFCCFNFIEPYLFLSTQDMKPNNLLINDQGVLKIGDFGLAKYYGSPSRPYSNQVVTR